MDRLKEFFKKAKAKIMAVGAAIVAGLYYAWDWLAGLFS